MKKSPLATLAGLVLLASPLAGSPPEPLGSEAFFAFLSPSDRRTLLDTGALTEVGTSLSELKVAQVPAYQDLMAQGLEVKGPTVASWGYFLFPKPRGNPSLALYNAVSAVSSMEGLEYYSVTDKKRQPLILASWRVASIQDPKKLPDPNFTEIPPLQRALIYQKDNRFGAGFSQVTWRALEGGAFLMVVENVTPLSFAFFRIVDTGGLKMAFVVVPLADRVAVCAGLEGRTAGIPGLEKSLNDSIRNRMKALAEWLGTRISGLS